MTEPIEGVPWTKVGTQMTRTISVQKVERFSLDELLAERKVLESHLTRLGALLVVCNERIAEAEKLGLKPKPIEPPKPVGVKS